MVFIVFVNVGFRWFVGCGRLARRISDACIVFGVNMQWAAFENLFVMCL